MFVHWRFFPASGAAQRLNMLFFHCKQQWICNATFKNKCSSVFCSFWNKCSRFCVYVFGEHSRAVLKYIDEETPICQCSPWGKLMHLFVSRFCIVFVPSGLTLWLKMLCFHCENRLIYNATFLKKCSSMLFSKCFVAALGSGLQTKTCTFNWSYHWICNDAVCGII